MQVYHWYCHINGLLDLNFSCGLPWSSGKMQFWELRVSKLLTVIEHGQRMHIFIEYLRSLFKKCMRCRIKLLKLDNVVIADLYSTSAHSNTFSPSQHETVLDLSSFRLFISSRACNGVTVMCWGWNLCKLCKTLLKLVGNMRGHFFTSRLTRTNLKILNMKNKKRIM